MDPNTLAPKENDSKLGKLEEDLQNLSKEVSTQTPPPAPPALTPVVDAPPSVAVPPMDTPVSTGLESAPPPEKKTSPILIVALVLMVIAILAAIAYVVGMRFSAKNALPTPVLTPSQEVVPTVVPEPTPIETATPTIMPTATPKGSASASATPSATP
jgi:hypothetical protein